MTVENTGLNIDFTARWTAVTPRLKNLAETELKRIGHLMGRAVSAHVILTEDKHRQIAEVTLQGASETLVATCEDTEMVAALHDALKKIEQQAIRHKERRMTVERHAKPASAEPLIELASPPAYAG